MPDNSAEPIWLSAVQVEAINRSAINDGERHTVLSKDLLESAVARPRNLYLYEDERDLVTLGVRLLVAIGKNHCFEQGNKRTASQACGIFLERNDVILDLAYIEENAKVIEAAIVTNEGPDALISLFRKLAY